MFFDLTKKTASPYKPWEKTKKELAMETEKRGRIRTKNRKRNKIARISRRINRK
jgi:hypothetical protein